MGHPLAVMLMVRVAWARAVASLVDRQPKCEISKRFHLRTVTASAAVEAVVEAATDRPVSTHFGAGPCTEMQNSARWSVALVVAVATAPEVVVLVAPCG